MLKVLSVERRPGVNKLEAFESAVKQIKQVEGYQMVTLSRTELKVKAGVNDKHRGTKIFLITKILLDEEAKKKTKVLKKRE
jgi:hypothetical protein